MAKVHHDRLTPLEPMSALANGAFRRENARELVRAFETGLNNKAHILGWHGTSLEAPADSSIFFFPADLDKDFRPRVPGAYHTAGRPGAEYYARYTAQTHFAMRTLGLDFRDPVHRRVTGIGLMHVESWESEGEDALKVLKELGVSKDRFIAVAKAALPQKGVLIALSAQHTAEFSIEHGDQAGWDKRVVAPGGLPLKCINGIEPLGDREYNFFQQLQDSLTQEQ
jgi:hypothetical protein